MQRYLWSCLFFVGLALWLGGMTRRRPDVEIDRRATQEEADVVSGHVIDPIRVPETPPHRAHELPSVVANDNSAGPSSQPEQERSAWVVRVSGLKPKGIVRIAIFDQPDGFPAADRAKYVLSSDAEGPVMDFRLEPLGSTKCAIAVFHDLDNDGSLSRNGFGIPTEPYGFSNNARGRFGPPSFNAAALPTADLGSGVSIIEVK